MSARRPDGGRADGATPRVVLEELRRRNPRAVSMDLLYLVATAFFAHLFVRGFWPAVIAAVPLASLLYFGWSSSRAFALAQVATVAATVAATAAGVIPP